jgi:putative SOS response-associated peptidase YedK
MCNDYGNHIPYSAYLEAFSETRVPVRFPVAAPNLQPREDIWPTDTAPVIRQAEDGVEFTQLRWGFQRHVPKELRLSISARRGGTFPRVAALCLPRISSSSPARSRQKSKWKFTKAGEGWFCFAGLWRPMPDGAADAFTLLTTEPGPDVAPIHNRQMVVLERSDWLAWLNLERDPRRNFYVPFRPAA